MSKIIYQPKGKAQEYCKWAANFYNGCSNKCLYCYNRHSQAKALLGKDEPTLKKGLRDENAAFRIFEKELAKYRSQIMNDGGELFFNFVSDPCLEETWELNARCIELAASHGIKARVLTKVANDKFFDKFISAKRKDCYAFGFTLTGHDELEPNASPTTERIGMLSYLGLQGFETWVSLEPIITIDKARDVFDMVCGFVDEIRIGLNSFHKDYTPQEVRDFMEWANRRVEDAGGHIEIMWKQSVLDYIKK